MNDTVPNFSSPGNQAWNKIPTHRDRVPIWPRTDMFHCLPILSVEDAARRAPDAPRSTLYALRFTLNALRRVPILSRKQIFYDVPIVHRPISESIA